MNTVKPIKDGDKIRAIESILKKQSQRDYILFELGIYSGLRISDILKLKVKDLRNQSAFKLKEQKTGKINKVAIHPNLKQELDSYLKDKHDDEYIIGSRERLPFITVTEKYTDPTTGRKKSRKVKLPNTAPNSPIDRVQAYRILNTAAKQVGLDNIGCHSTRKTWGSKLYETSKDIIKVQKLLNHSSPEVTLRYIGLEKEDLDDLVCSIEY